MGFDSYSSVLSLWVQGCWSCIHPPGTFQPLPLPAAGFRTGAWLRLLAPLLCKLMDMPLDHTSWSPLLYWLHPSTQRTFDHLAGR